jgi:hypothetical protein
MISTLPQIVVFGYLGPETLVPAASVIAAGIGIVLTAWRLGWRMICRMVRFLIPAETSSDADARGGGVHFNNELASAEQPSPSRRRVSRPTTDRSVIRQ